MLFSQVSLAVILVFLGFFDIGGKSTPVIIFTLAFIAFFEFGSGPITWLYMSEIMCDKALSIATVVNWVVCLVISAIIPSLVAAITHDGDDDNNIGWIFIVLAVFTVLGLIFQLFFMLETRGKTPQQIEDMFTGIERKYSEVNIRKRVDEPETQNLNDSGKRLII